MQISGISVVIPAFNEEKFLPETLTAVNAARALLKIPSEMIVVDNKSTDQTQAVAQKHGARVLSHSTRNISAVRNAGIREAKYELILTIDADCKIPENAFIEVLSLMSTGQYIGGSLNLNVISDKWITRATVCLVQSFVEAIAGIRGAIFFFFKDDALAFGGFDETKLVAEDSTFAIVLKKLGSKRAKKFGLLKDVVVTTVDRKDTTLLSFAPMAVKGLLAFAGKKLTQKDLPYWYNPKR